MVSKELKKLSRRELVDIIYQLKKNEQLLQDEIASLREALQDRRIHLSTAGSIAEAAISITNVFSSAQAAADIYLQEVSCMKQDAEIECTIENGIIRASKIQISGDVFSITGSGTYSIPEDKIDITARVRIFKNNSIIGKLANPITWTFSKLLMEFKVSGSVDNPKWEYISVIERLL
jgi:hypothetical protein